MAKPEPTKSAFRSALSLADRRDIFVSSGESDPPSPRRSRSAESDKGHDLATVTILTVIQSCIRVRVIGMILVSGTSIDTRRGTVDRNILRVAPEKKPWLPPHRVLARLSDTTSDRYRIRLSDSSKLHKLDSSASNFRTGHDSSSMLSSSIDGTVVITSVMVPL